MTRLLVTVVLLAAACGKDLDELAPFPCAARQQCPDSLTCIDEVCVAPRVDAPCIVGDADPCGLTTPASKCVARDLRSGNGLCKRQCTSDDDCGGDRCIPSYGCVADCSADDTVCPPGEVCRDRRGADQAPSGIRVCLGEGLPANLADPCVGDESCQRLMPGSVCAKGPGGYGLCAKPCTDCPAPGVCHNNFCTSSCVNQTDCAAGYRCELLVGPVQIARCIPMSPSLAAGEVCAAKPDCAQPMECTEGPVGPRCTPLCSKQMCAAGLACLQPDDPSKPKQCYPADPKTAGCSVTSPAPITLVAIVLLSAIGRRGRRSRRALPAA